MWGARLPASVQDYPRAVLDSCWTSYKKIFSRQKSTFPRKIFLISRVDMSLVLDAQETKVELFLCQKICRDKPVVKQIMTSKMFVGISGKINFNHEKLCLTLLILNVQPAIWMLLSRFRLLYAAFHGLDAAYFGYCAWATCTGSDVWFCLLVHSREKTSFPL